MDVLTKEPRAKSTTIVTREPLNAPTGYSRNHGEDGKRNGQASGSDTHLKSCFKQPRTDEVEARSPEARKNEKGEGSILRPWSSGNSASKVAGLVVSWKLGTKAETCTRDEENTFHYNIADYYQDKDNKEECFCFKICNSVKDFSVEVALQYLLMIVVVITIILASIMLIYKVNKIAKIYHEKRFGEKENQSAQEIDDCSDTTNDKGPWSSLSQTSCSEKQTALPNSTPGAESDSA